MKTLLASAIALAAVTSAFGAAGTTAASAADGKVIAATECYSKGIAFTTTRGSLENASLTLPTNVFCALPRDNPLAKPVKVEVNVIDNSSLVIADGLTGNFACQVNATDKFGKVLAQGPIVKTSGVNSAGTTLNLPLPNAVFPKGSYIVKCQMPRRGTFDPNSVFASIYFQETIEP